MGEMITVGGICFSIICREKADRETKQDKTGGELVLTGDD